MRPVNLIPPDERRGSRAPLRAGALSYLIVAGLGLVLLGVIVLGLTSKSISDKEDEVASLEQELQGATARAEALAPFVNFRSAQERRTGTIKALAESRFDWERVLNELALIMPRDVWLVQMSGTASPAVSVEEAPDIAARDTVQGPALEIIGCAVSQDAVAGFVADLEDIDGVTRVGVSTSELPDDENEANSGGVVASDSAGGDAEECRTRPWIPRFEIVVAFDAVPVPGEATTAPAVPAPAGDAGSLAQAQQSTQNATNLVPGG
jgi:Tfp pilus assembly protein PilN